MSKLLLLIIIITYINCYASAYDDFSKKIKSNYDTIISLQKNIQRFNKFNSDTTNKSKEFDNFLNKQDATHNDAKNIFDKLSWLAMEIVPQTPAPEYKKGFEFKFGKISIREYDSEIKRTGFYENEMIFKILAEALKSKNITFASYAYDQILEKSRYDFLLNNSQLIKDGLEIFVRNIDKSSPINIKKVNKSRQQADSPTEISKLIKYKSIEDFQLYYYLNLTDEEIKSVLVRIKDAEQPLISAYFDKLIISKYSDVDKTILEYNTAEDFEIKSRLLATISFVNNEQTFKSLVLSLGSDLFEYHIKIPRKIANLKITSLKISQKENASSNNECVEKYPDTNQIDKAYWMFRYKVFKEIVRSGRDFCNRDKLQYIGYGINKGASREEQQTILDEMVICVKSKYNLEIKINPENNKNIFTNYESPHF